MPLTGLERFHVVACDIEKGLGLFTDRAFKSGDIIYPFDYWSQDLMPIHLTNHSCDPNAAFDEAGMLVALRDIDRGEEITYDYLMHPIPAAPWNFKCQCRSAKCVGWIAAGKSSTAQQSKN